MSRKTWPCGHHISEGIIDGTALNQGQGLKSPGSPWPWLRGPGLAGWRSSAPLPSALLLPGPSPCRSQGHLSGSSPGGLAPWGSPLRRPALGGPGAETSIPRPSGGIRRRPGLLPGAWQCSCCHPGSSMAFVFLPFNFVLSGVFCRFPPEGAPEQSPRPAQSGLRMHVLCRFTCHSLFDQTGLGADSVPGGWVRTPVAGPRVCSAPRGDRLRRVPGALELRHEVRSGPADGVVLAPAHSVTASGRSEAAPPGRCGRGRPVHADHAVPGSVSRLPRAAVWVAGGREPAPGLTCWPPRGPGPRV